jgi:hypothetical protein
MGMMTRKLRGYFQASSLFPTSLDCVILSPMGNKDKGKKETKKAPKPKPKPEPGRKRELFTPAPPK